MAATIKANSNPSPEPTTIPHLVDCTLRANHPLSRPTTMPLIDEPTIMPVSNGRASGVNQAVAPSIAPRISPNSNPTRILFIVAPPPGIPHFPEFLYGEF